MKKAMDKKEFTSAVREVFDACRRLSVLSGNNRPFTPDGRMVGDIGEVMAGSFYEVELDKIGRRDWDGIYRGRKVQIKTTGGTDTYLKRPEEGFGSGLLMVFWINRENGECRIVYNGDVQRVWGEIKNLRPDRTGAKMISLDRLKQLQGSVRPEDVIPRRGETTK